MLICTVYYWYDCRPHCTILPLSFYRCKQHFINHFNLGLGTNTEFNITPMYELSLAGLFTTTMPVITIEEVFDRGSTPEENIIEDKTESSIDEEKTESYILFDKNLLKKVQE